MNKYPGFVPTLLFIALALAGCSGSSSDSKAPTPMASQVPSMDQLNQDNFGFDLFWPPRDISHPGIKSEKPLLTGELSVLPVTQDPENAFQLCWTLERPQLEPDRIRWNKNLAFPEYSWMSKVRVWDREHQWLWPNLPFLLSAYGKERVERYGGIDPGKGIDNDFAAVLIRPLPLKSADLGQLRLAQPEQPLVSAQWLAVPEKNTDKRSVIHIARSDIFTVQLAPFETAPRTGRLGAWLIYADFLDASPPRNWPVEAEYNGGILAYFEIVWKQNAIGKFEFDIRQLVPPSGTGFDWASWSLDPPILQKKLNLRLSTGAKD